MKVTSINTTIVVHCKYYNLNFLFLSLLYLQCESCYWGQLHKTDESVKSCKETEFHLKSFSALCASAWQVLVRTIEYRWNNFSHYFALEGATIFSPSHCFSWTVFDLVVTLFAQRTRLAHIPIQCEVSGWGLMESWELVKILIVSGEITLFLTGRCENGLKLKLHAQGLRSYLHVWRSKRYTIWGLEFILYFIFSRPCQLILNTRLPNNTKVTDSTMEWLQPSLFVFIERQGKERQMLGPCNWCPWLSGLGGGRLCDL